MFSLTTNSHKFSVDCLKGIVKDNKGKVCKIGKGTGSIVLVDMIKEYILNNLKISWGNESGRG